MNKSKTTILLAIVILTACSAPKYAYYFDHHDYNAGKRSKQSVKEVNTLAIDPEMLVATTSNQPVVLSAPTESPTAVAKPYSQMNKTERKAVRVQLKREIKAFMVGKKKANSPESVNSAKGMDHDLKLAAIFGVVGIVALLIGTTVFNVVGAIALLIGLVFFVKWLMRQ